MPRFRHAIILAAALLLITCSASKVSAQQPPGPGWGAQVVITNPQPNQQIKKGSPIFVTGTITTPNIGRVVNIPLAARSWQAGDQPLNLQGMAPNYTFDSNHPMPGVSTINAPQQVGPATITVRAFDSNNQLVGSKTVQITIVN